MSARQGTRRAKRAEVPPLPSYSALRKHAAWTDAEGRFYVDAGADGDGDAYVLLPLGETRRRGTPASAALAGVEQIEFPESGDALALLPLVLVLGAHQEMRSDERFAAALAQNLEHARHERVASVGRLRQRGAVACIEFENVRDGAGQEARVNGAGDSGAGAGGVSAFRAMLAAR